MSEHLRLGELIEEGRDPPPRRDAVHVAVAPAVAGGDLERGTWVSVSPKGLARTCPEGRGAVGVVDPFLSSARVRNGQRFWVYLRPGSITGLRHEWQHPAFPPDEPESDATAREVEALLQGVPPFLEEAARRLGVTVRDLVDEIASEGGVNVGHQEDISSDAHAHVDEIRTYVERVLGRPVPDIYFSCAC